MAKPRKQTYTLEMYLKLTVVQMQEYIEVDCQLGLMERQKRKEQRDSRA